MSIDIWELALILLFIVVAVGVVALITRISRGNNESHHPTDSHKNHHPHP
ncbi:hypothetical protein [Corynebacterium tuberculostearicum]|nr:hypothetical protein [Corynebacterium tuberculostearicum]QRQ67210.1 hypothetical protein I6J28_00295 [Corynebacterium tuberculostearicum]WKE55966.1 hypothetical protein J8245_04475 [Corynebacterium tuberculostearicum]